MSHRNFAVLGSPGGLRGLGSTIFRGLKSQLPICNLQLPEISVLSKTFSKHVPQFFSKIIKSTGKKSSDPIYFLPTPCTTVYYNILHIECTIYTRDLARADLT